MIIYSQRNYPLGFLVDKGSNLVYQTLSSVYVPCITYTRITFDKMKELYGISDCVAANATAYAFASFYFNSIIGNTIQLMTWRGDAQAPGYATITGVGI